MRGGFHAKPRNVLRRLALAALALAHFVVSSGVPIPTASHLRKPTDRPFPCMERPCGCETYEQCWAGDCCCFSMAEKLAWAKANDITPPASARVRPAATPPLPAAEPECPYCEANRQPTPRSCCLNTDTGNPTVCPPVTPNCPDCEKPAPDGETRTAGWVSVLFAQKCRGEAFAGVGVLPVAVAPEPPFIPSFDTTEISRLPLIDHVPAARATPPDAPPPKSA